MAIYRNKTQQYTNVSHSVIRDDNLSLKDLGLLVRLLSLPDNWEFSERGLFAMFEQDGATSIRTGLKNLERLGYLKREQKSERGKFSQIEWSIYDVPQLFENPCSENPITENPITENQTQHNINKPIINEVITNKQKERKTSPKQTGYDLILNAVSDESLKELYYEYIKMRKLIKSPMTDRALTMLITKVNELEPQSIERQKRLLEVAIMNNWKSVYPLKDNSTQGHNSQQGTGNIFVDMLNGVQSQ